MAYVCVQINLASNYIGGYYDTNQGKVLHTPEGPKAISDALRVSPSLTSIDLRGNYMEDKGKALLRKAVEGRAGFKLLL